MEFLCWEECYNYCNPCKGFYPCFLIIIYVWTFAPVATCHDLICYLPYVASTSISICPTCNDACDDTDNSVVFLALFLFSLVVNIVLVVVIIYLIVKQKKVTTYSPQT